MCWYVSVLGVKHSRCDGLKQALTGFHGARRFADLFTELMAHGELIAVVEGSPFFSVPRHHGNPGETAAPIGVPDLDRRGSRFAVGGWAWNAQLVEHGLRHGA